MTNANLAALQALPALEPAQFEAGFAGIDCCSYTCQGSASCGGTCPKEPIVE